MSVQANWQQVELAWRPTEPDEVWRLAAAIVARTAPGTDLALVERVYRDVLALFGGTYPGYQPVRTPYHNLGHTLGVFLCTARLLHGARLAGQAVGGEDIESALIAALLHDSGYALAASEGGGSGGELTMVHVERGVDFMRRYFAGTGEERLGLLECAIRCTDMHLLPERMVCDCGQARLAGRLVGTADLVSQMADRDYLERLLFLYYEFRDAGFGDFDSIHRLLEKTVDFYTLARRRIDDELGGAAAWLRLHFRDWLHVDANLYLDAVEKNMAYLHEVLHREGEARLAMLKRGGIVDLARRLGAL